MKIYDASIVRDRDNHNILSLVIDKLPIFDSEGRIYIDDDVDNNSDQTLYSMSYTIDSATGFIDYMVSKRTKGSAPRIVARTVNPRCYPNFAQFMDIQVFALDKCRVFHPGSPVEWWSIRETFYGMTIDSIKNVLRHFGLIDKFDIVATRDSITTRYDVIDDDDIIINDGKVIMTGAGLITIEGYMTQYEIVQRCGTNDFHYDKYIKMVKSIIQDPTTVDNVLIL